MSSDRGLSSKGSGAIVGIFAFVIGCLIGWFIVIPFLSWLFVKIWSIIYPPYALIFSGLFYNIYMRGFISLCIGIGIAAELNS